MSSSTLIDPLFVAVCGSSGVGKTAFVDALTTRFPDRFRRAKSVTTRSRREGEGLAEYDFISEAEFRKLADSGHLLNADQVHGNWYGISAQKVNATVAAGLIPVKEMAAKNVAQLRSRGFQPVVASIEAAGMIAVRQGREGTDQDELGIASSDGVASFRIRRGEHSAISMAEQFRRWMDAALALDETGFSMPSHSPLWDEGNRVGYDAIASEFTDDLRITTAYFHALSEPFWRDIRDRLLNQESYLEVAPGRGWLADYLAWPTGSAYRGLELSSVMRQLNARAEQIDIGTASAMPYDSEAFRGVLGSLVDPFLNASFLAETIRVLRPGGWLAFTTPAAAWARALRGEGSTYETQFIRSDGSATSVGSACIDPVQIQKALTILGFNNVRVADVSVERGSSEVPPAVRTALNRLPTAVDELAVITTCWAEKPA